MHLFPKILIPALLAIPLCSASRPPIVLPDMYLTSNTIGPLSTYQDNVDLNVVVHSKTNTRTFYDYFRCGPNKNDIRYSKYGGLRYMTTFTYNLTFNIPTKDYLSLKGMYCVIILKDFNNQYELNFEFTLTPMRENRNIKAEDYASSVYTIKYVSFYFDQTGFHQDYETIEFPDYLSYLNIDTYHKITLESVKFVSSSLNFQYTSAFLLIPDYQNVFPYITHNANHQISIPLQLTLNNDKSFTFAYKNKMYVNPKNAQMSLIPREKFVITNNFYVPVNEKEKLVDEKIQINLNGFSISKVNISWSLEYLANTNLIGDCESSEYCIVGEEV